MEEVSAFAAYQKSNEQNNVKSQKPRTPKSTNGRVHFAVPSSNPPKKHQKTVSSEKQTTEQTTQKTKSVTTNGMSTGLPAKGPTAPKKMKTNPQPQNHSNMNGVTVQQNGSISSATNDELHASSVENGQNAFAHILSGYGIKQFMQKNWEKNPLYIARENRHHYDRLKMSTEAIDEMLRTNNIEFTKNLDITSYVDGVRETHNPDGRALPGSVWDFYRDGCSVRLLNPQTFITPLQKFNEMLQEYFHCLVGANVYLTPQNSQGFAPHYDDIEAFVLQIEGKKEWTLYHPRNENEKLPRESSGNFQQDEIGEPHFTQILEPGDMLYFPRGWIHQAKTVPNCHSMHITLSVYQKMSYADLFEELTKDALNKAIQTNVDLRRGLPLDIWNQFGESYVEYDQISSRRKDMKQLLFKMFNALQNYIDIDGAVDKMAIKYQHDALPPVLSTAEKARTTFGTKLCIHDNGKIEMPEMDERTKVRLLRANIVRLTVVEGKYQLYYYADNSKEYHGSDLNFIEVEEAAVGVIKKLIHLYPLYSQIQELADNFEEAMAVVCNLWERGLLMTLRPLG